MTRAVGTKDFWSTHVYLLGWRREVIEAEWPSGEMPVQDGARDSGAAHTS